MSDEGHNVREEQRYYAAAHRVQTAIAVITNNNPVVKDLRVGIDMSKADTEGLVTLLLAKGIFTKEEYLTAIADSAEREAARYENELSSLLGRNVTTL